MKHVPVIRYAPLDSSIRKYDAVMVEHREHPAAHTAGPELHRFQRVPRSSQRYAAVVCVLESELPGTHVIDGVCTEALWKKQERERIVYVLSLSGVPSAQERRRIPTETGPTIIVF